MKTIIAICSMALAVLPQVSDCAPSERTEKTTVTGVVVDHDHGILILKDHKGWDRKQTEYAPIILSPKTRKWLQSFDKSHAAIFIKADDAKRIRNGMRVTIEGYSYFWDERDIYLRNR